MFNRPALDPAYEAEPLVWNPLLDGWLQAVRRQASATAGAGRFRINGDALMDMFRSRDTLTRQYGCSVPTGPVIRAIVAQAPRIVELGAGSGYWAKLLADEGADVLAFDAVCPGQTNDYFGGQEVGTWHPVNCGDVSVLKAHRDRALLLCWPPYGDPMALNAVNAWDGELVIFVGEGYGGCCADDDFFAKMDDEFERVAVLDLPQWDGIHDAVWIWKRLTPLAD